MSVVRRRVVAFVVLVLSGATFAAVVPASAQVELCFGKPATIVAEAGQPTVGTDGDDVIVGTPGVDDIRGGPGDDSICGLGGADLIFGNGGDDQLDGDAGRDHISGGPGRDLIRGGSGADELHGNKGQDLIRGKRGNDRVWGGNGDDIIFGGPGDDVIFGGRQDDKIFGNSDDDILAGGKGDDVVEGGKGHDLLKGKSGNDTLRGKSGDDQVFGGLGADFLLGNDGEDGLFGGSGQDICRGGRATDTLLSCEAMPEVVTAVPGDSIEYTVIERLGANMVDREFEAWLVPFPNSTAGEHALAGQAVVRSETVDLALTISDAFIALEAVVSGGPPVLGQISPLQEGIYSVWVGGQQPEYAVPVQRLEGLVIDVTAPGRLENPDMSHVIVDPLRALAGQTSLGDVLFGTPALEALAALEAIFGPPISDSGWRDGCWFGRDVNWPGLGVEFHGTGDETGKFVSFMTTGDTVLGPLTTADGVAVGMSVAEVMALTPTSGFSSDRNSSSPSALTWWADTEAFGGLAGRLGVDATHPDATLISIGNGSPNPFFGC